VQRRQADHVAHADLGGPHRNAGHHRRWRAVRRQQRGGGHVRRRGARQRRRRGHARRRVLAVPRLLLRPGHERTGGLRPAAGQRQGQQVGARPLDLRGHGGQPDAGLPLADDAGPRDLQVPRACVRNAGGRGHGTCHAPFAFEAGSLSRGGGEPLRDSPGTPGITASILLLGPWRPEITGGRNGSGEGDPPLSLEC